jgi:hypothetical protein
LEATVGMQQHFNDIEMTMPAPEPFTLPIHCAYCHARATLMFLDWRGLAGPMRLETWVCPSCLAVNSGGFPGHLIQAEPYTSTQ